MEIHIKTIPHDQHRYTTVGDWWTDEKGVMQIRVSELSDWRREFLIIVHEMIEAKLCENEGITQAQVDQFDMNYEEHPDEEPGDDPKAPYVKQHCLATGVERILAALFGVNWKEYEQELRDLPEVPEKKPFDFGMPNP